MNLAFMTKWPVEMGKMAGKPTRFPEKIATCFISQMNSDKDIRDKAVEMFTSWNMTELDNRYLIDGGLKPLWPKLHTIRHDIYDRWKKGVDIHFLIHNRTKDMFRFAPIVTVKSIQKILIKWNLSIDKYNNHLRSVTVVVDNRRLSPEEIEKLAINDGFENATDFFKFFNEDFLGKIIHWTHLKY